MEELRCLIPDVKSPKGRRPRFAGYGLQIGGGRTRIRTRVFGLEGQSDIQLHYTSLSQGQGLHFKKVQQESVAQRGLAHLWHRLGFLTVVRFHS